jgi:hypothetical protein
VIETCTDNCNMKINASETTVPQITEVFDLKFNKGKKWALAEDSLVGVPSMLSMSQQLGIYIPMLITVRRAEPA